MRGARVADPGTMPGLVKRAAGAESVGLQQVPRPVAGPGQVVLRILATGICGTDLHIVTDEYVSTPPLVLGHETCGIVAEVGPGADPSLVGRRVAPETFFVTCDVCERCREGRRNLCASRRSIGTHVDGGFAPWLLIPARNL